MMRLIGPPVPQEESRLHRDLSTATLVIGFIAMAGDFIVPAVLGKWYPNYSNIRKTISELGTEASPVRRQASAWLIILGVLFICFGVAQAIQLNMRTLFHWLYVSGIVAFGVGAGIIAGLFPEDSQGKAETPTGKIHGICAGLGFILLILNPLWALGIDEFNGLEWVNAGFFAMGVVTFTVFLASEKRTDGVLGWSGLWQRLTLLMVYSPLLLNHIAMKV